MQLETECGFGCNYYGCVATGVYPRHGCNAQQPLSSECQAEGCYWSDKLCTNPACP
jgi:hypothetical protein